jgi:hypothetical protein
MHGLRNQIFTLRLGVLYLQYKIVLSIQEIIKNTYAVYNRSSINVGFGELKGKPLNTTFLLAPFWLKANTGVPELARQLLIANFNISSDKDSTTKNAKSMLVLK